MQPGMFAISFRLGRHDGHGRKLPTKVRNDTWQQFLLSSLLLFINKLHSVVMLMIQSYFRKSLFDIYICPLKSMCVFEVFASNFRLPRIKFCVMHASLLDACCVLASNALLHDNRMTGIIFIIHILYKSNVVNPSLLLA